MLCFKGNYDAASHHLMVKIWALLGKKYVSPIFGQNRRILPPGVLIYRNTSYCLVTYFEGTLSCFISKVFLWLFGPTKWFKLRSY